MRLWIKISLICTVVLLLTVSICSTILLLYSKDRILSFAIEDILHQEDSLSNSFSRMVLTYGQEDNDPVAARSLAQYCFKLYAGEASVLKSSGGEVYSNVGFDPEMLLLLTGNAQQSNLSVIDGRHMLIAGSKVTLFSVPYSIFVVRDVTEIYQNISLMIARFAVISGFCILAGMGIIVFLVRLSAKPLKSLGASARRIAQGEYSERAAVRSKDEVGDLAQDFNRMAEAVESNYQALKEFSERQKLFIGGLTHEFKTPLTSVIGYAETLLYTSMPQDMVENALIHINEQCKWLERLTQKLLRLITLQEAIELKEESVQALMDAVVVSTKEVLVKRGVNLNTTCEVKSLPMDFDLMLSLVVNLVDNAAKASHEGQTVEIAAYGRTLEINDKGIGIPEEELSRVTEPFYRVDKSRSKKLGGSGLGLSLVKMIAEAHGASLTIESTLGRGTKVKIVFPANKRFTF